MKITIDKIRNRLVARDEAGNILAERKTYCNPSALSQIVMDAGTLGEIDWESSHVAPPRGRGQPAKEPTKQIRAYAADVPRLAAHGKTQSEAVRKLLSEVDLRKKPDPAGTISARLNWWKARCDELSDQVSR
jgi:hypothetical protein